MNVHHNDDQPKVAFDTGRDPARVVFTGQWVIRTSRQAEELLADLQLPSGADIEFDISTVKRLDTAGAWLIHRYRGEVEYRGARVRMLGIGPEHRILINEIESHHPPPAPTYRKANPLMALFERTGRVMFGIAEDARSVFNIMGAFAMALARGVVRPRQLRMVSVVHVFDRAGLEATSIVVLMSFLIGMIIAQQGMFYLRQFGADLFVVDLVGVLTLREMGVLLTAIMIAGRSGSAFTAEIGAMRMREEIDALHVIGMSATEVLVVPRILALMIALPILTFLADLASLAGASLAVWTYAGIPPETFVIRLREAISVQTMLIGLVKAPFMALIIGLISCVEGLKVEGSAESLGLHTTAAVVKSIFMVIVVDGIFAVFFATINV